MRDLRSYQHSIRWRLAALGDPAGFAAGEDPIAGARDGAVRRDLLEEAGRLTLRDRLRLVSPAHSTAPIEELLLRRRLRHDEHGEPFFALAGRRLYFAPQSYRGRIDRLMDGILFVLKEAYLMPLEFFGDGARIRPGDTVLDVGGNIGTSAMLFSRLTGPSGRVITFEPIFPDVLERNLRHNGIDNVEVVPQAVGAESGEVEFEVTDQGIDARMRSGNTGDGPHMRVPVTTLDAWLDGAGIDRVDFVKMDIEGAEERALQGAEYTRRERRPAWSLASYHTDPEGDAQHPKLMRLLRGDGYDVREHGGERILAWCCGGRRRAAPRTGVQNQGSSAVGP